MTLPLLVALSQLADGLAYQLAVGHGIEANPLMAPIGDPGALLAVKVAGALVVGGGSLLLVRRWPPSRAVVVRRVVAWFALAGFVGCLSELAVLA